MRMQKNKSQFKRLMALVDLIREQKRPVNCLILGEDEFWGVSQKTVQRDIEFLRDQMNAPIAYDRERKSYYFTEATWSMPALVVTEGEILSVLLASRVLEQYHGTPAAANLREIFDKLAEMLPDKVSIPPENLFTRFSFRGPPARPVKPEVWSTVIQGLSAQKTVRLRYRPFEAAKAEAGKESRVNPYHIANLQGEWYLFGVHDGHSDVRQFAMARIEQATMTGDAFQVPSDFDPEKLLADTFGRFSGNNESHVVRLLFAKEVARWVEEREWHPKQTLRTRRSGEVELSFPAKGLYEVQRWVLSWGHSVKVLSPKELRDTVREEVRMMASTVG
jgi:predicted DNA-binding transcriptional regulator YafY